MHACSNGANQPCSVVLQQAAHQTYEDAVDLGKRNSLQLERMPTSCSRRSTVQWLPAPWGGSGFFPALRHFQRSAKGTVNGVCFYCRSTSTILPPILRRSNGLKRYKRSVGPGAPVGAQATEKSTAQRAVQGTPIDRSAYKKRPYQNKDTKLEPKQDKRSHRDITKTQRVLLDKTGTIVSESGTNSPVAHQNSRGR